jgi:serine/threonine protein phosphatase 1
MSRWRPSNNCLYVISDINGMHNELELILSRILPLRKTGGQIDKLIFLGNYMGGIHSHKTIDRIIQLKIENPHQIICLMGDTDFNFIESLNPNGNPEAYKSWLSAGGENSLLGYLELVNSDIYNPYLLKRQYIQRFIPKEHLEFFKLLSIYYETDNYIFVHGGCDPNVSLSQQSVEVLVKDRSVFRLVYNGGKGFKCKWDRVMITGGIGNKHGNPFVHDKFINLDGSCAEKLYVLELNSRQLFSARKGKSRLVNETICE